MNIIYDFETLSQEFKDGAVLGLAALEYDDKKFIEDDGYDYDELIDEVKFIKFDVVDQVRNHGRKINPDTLDWWKSQGKEAQKILDPSSEDVSITTLLSWINKNFSEKYKKVFTRGNTFDPMFLVSLIGHDPFDWWAIRDTRSYIDALLLGIDDMDNKFVPSKYKDKFIAHDPRHDIVMDVMRMQVLHRGILL